MLHGDVSPCNSAYFTYRVRFYIKSICDHWVVALIIFILLFQVQMYLKHGLHNASEYFSFFQASGLPVFV